MHIDFDCSDYSGSSLSRHSIADGNQSAYLQPFLKHVSPPFSEIR